MLSIMTYPIQALKSGTQWLPLNRGCALNVTTDVVSDSVGHQLQ